MISSPLVFIDHDDLLIQGPSGMVLDLDPYGSDPQVDNFCDEACHSMDLRGYMKRPMSLRLDFCHQSSNELTVIEEESDTDCDSPVMELLLEECSFEAEVDDSGVEMRDDTEPENDGESLSDYRWETDDKVDYSPSSADADAAADFTDDVVLPLSSQHRTGGIRFRSSLSPIEELPEPTEHIGAIIRQFPQPPSFFAKSQATPSLATLGNGCRHHRKRLGVVFDFPRVGRDSNAW